MKIPAHTETTLVREALQALETVTGARGRILPEPATKNRHFRPDAIVEIVLEGRKLTFLAEVKRTDRLEILGHVRAQLETAIQTEFPNHRPLLITPFMTRELAERCRAIELAFLDTAGNAYLHADGIFLYVTGQPKPRHLERTTFRADTAAGLRVVFAILCEPTLAGKAYREIAALTGVALGAIGPVLKDLERRGFLQRGREPQLKLNNGQRLFDEWLTHYPAVLRPKLHPRRYQAEPQRVLHVDPAKHDACWGGEVAAERLTGHLKPERFTLYTRGAVPPLLAEARMRLDPNGNTEVLEAFWPEALNRKEPALAPPFLVYADLMSANEARNLETAKLIYERFIEPAFGQQ